MFLIGAFVFLICLVMSQFEATRPESIIGVLAPYFERYGLAIVFFGYVLESLFVISFYFPGSFVLFMAVLASPGTLWDLASIWVTVNVAAAVGLSGSYFIGRTHLSVWLRRFMSGKLFKGISGIVTRYGDGGFLLLGVHVNWLSIAITSAGAFSERSFARTMAVAIVSHLVWSAALLAALAAVGEQVAQGNNLYIVVAAVFFLFGFTLCLADRYLARAG